MTPGHLMASEIAQAPSVFATTAGIDQSAIAKLAQIGSKSAIYTVARGSSDAAANILSYEFMRELGLPMTSLPPSVFSVGNGVQMDNTATIVISQSGASDDLVRSVRGIRDRGGLLLAITNMPGSAVEKLAHATLAMGAGPELAVPATKSVAGSIAAGMALLAALRPGYDASGAGQPFDHIHPHPQAQALTDALLQAQHIYVIGRDTGYGAAHEVALKLKECCALHAEAYSSAEVLHGPLQLVTKPLLIVMLDTGLTAIQGSLDTAEARFRAAGCTVFRLRPSDIGVTDILPAAAAALLLCLIYPVILATALALGHDPDRPATLSKVTQTT
jgi:glutamine---fructose-6-phosphate transaminase (isomerizing)